jgi:hypothetical protein
MRRHTCYHMLRACRMRCNCACHVFPTLLFQGCTTVAAAAAALAFSPCRAPRLTWDCGLLSNRVQLAPNLTLTLNHLILTNCSTTQPLSIIRLSAGSRVLINDSVIVQPPGLCVPLQEQASTALHSGRPGVVEGVQSISPGVAGGWCAHNDSSGLGDRVVVSDGPADNSSYSAVLVTTDNMGLFANTTGGCDVFDRFGICCAPPASVAQGSHWAAAFVAGLLFWHSRQTKQLHSLQGGCTQ